MSPGAADVGSAREEAARLLAALRGWVNDHVAIGESQCQVCPLCQLIAALRESRPEVAQHLIAAGASLAAAARALLDGAAEGPGRSADATMEHIDIAGDEG